MKPTAIDSRDPKQILREPYSRIVTPQDDGTFMAEILEFYGCLAQGDTPQEALAILEKMAVDWLAIAIERGSQVPEPLGQGRHSGKLALRMPKSLHRQAARIAARDGASLNQYIVASIAKSVGADDVMSKLGHLSRIMFEHRPSITANVNVSFQGPAEDYQTFQLPFTRQPAIP